MTARDRTVQALGALAVLQLLHLLDDLRTDDTADLASVLLSPQPVLGLGGTLLALFAVRRGSRYGRALALTMAGTVALGFIVSHGVPAETAATTPYWGDGSADVLQWLGVTLILACCAATAVFARRLPAAARA